MRIEIDDKEEDTDKQEAAFDAASKEDKLRGAGQAFAIARRQYGPAVKLKRADYQDKAGDWQTRFMPVDTKTESTFDQLEGWEKKSFDILVSQSLNLTIAAKTPQDQEKVEAKRYFALLLELRGDPVLQELYAKKIRP